MEHVARPGAVVLGVAVHDAPTFLSDIAIVTCVAAITGLLARAVGQPSILGYLFAGLIVGPSIPIPLFADPSRTEALAEFGVVLVMFAVGLEFRVSRLLAVLPVSGFTALVQVGTLMWVGVTLGTALGWSAVGAAFLGACLAISSTMVVTGIFGQAPVERDVREHVLGVLVVQDLVAIVLMATMTALAAGQSLAAGGLLALLARLAGVLAAMLGLGILVVPRLVRLAVRQGATEGVVVLAVGLAFGLALVANQVGYSVALGAFVAGILVAESGRGPEVEHAIEPLRAVFASIFFVSVGMTVDPAVAWEHLPLALLVAAAVVVFQLVSVTAASLLSGSPLRKALLAGLALGQIGELSFILATIGTEADVVPDALLPTLVTVATITCFTTPLLLRRGDRLVHAVDHALPARVQHLLAVHQGFVARVRAEGGRDAGVRHALRALAVDGVALVVLGAAAATVQAPASAWAMATLEVGRTVAVAAVTLPLVLIAVPLVVGLLRSARQLARLSTRMIDDGSGPGALGPAARLLEAVVHLALVVGVGVPALATLRPLVAGPWGEPLLLVATLAALALVWRNLGSMETGFRSGAEELARRLARHAGPDASDLDDQHLLPGLDHVRALPLGQAAHAVGLTLAQLDLRARSGATVVAIHKPGAEVVLPTGHERLEPGDVLALAGSADALAAACDLLTSGARTPADAP